MHGGIAARPLASQDALTYEGLMQAEGVHGGITAHPSASQSSQPSSSVASASFGIEERGWARKCKAGVVHTKRLVDLASW